MKPPDQWPEIDLSFPNRKIVYALFDGDELVYVGKSINGFDRVREHASGKTEIHFDSARFMICPTDIDLPTLEAILIVKYKPKHNRNLPQNEIYHPPRKLSQTLELSPRQLDALLSQLSPVFTTRNERNNHSFYNVFEAENILNGETKHGV